MSRQRCTGVAAVWCPIHGDCTCPPMIDPATGKRPASNPRDMNDERCPLHSTASTHAT